MPTNKWNSHNQSSLISRNTSKGPWSRLQFLPLFHIRIDNLRLQSNALRRIFHTNPTFVLTLKKLTRVDLRFKTSNTGDSKNEKKNLLYVIYCSREVARDNQCKHLPRPWHLTRPLQAAKTCFFFFSPYSLVRFYF